jgi:hypothetical protein
VDAAGRRRASDWLVAAAYLGLVVVFTWPGVTKVFSEFSSLDPTYTAWGLSWVEHQLFDLHNPWYTADMFAPTGTWLAFSNLSPLAGALLSPLTATIGAGATTNLTKLAIPVASSYATYRLALRLGLARAPAFATGALYGCSQVLMWRADSHFNLAAGSIFPPLALLAVIRLRESRRARDAAVLGVVFGATALIDQTYLLFTALIVAAFVAAVSLIENAEGRRSLLRGLAVGAGVALLVASPQLWMMLRQRDAGQYRPEDVAIGPSWVEYGTSPIALLAPTNNLEDRIGPRLGGWAHERGEGLANYGLGLLVLAASGAVLAFRRRLVKWLVAVWLALSLLALGPTIVIGDDTFTPLAVHSHDVDVSLLMPYTWLVHVPGLADVRVAARFGLLAMLPLALLAGIGIGALMARPGRLPKAVLLIGLAIAIVELGNPMRFSGPMEFDELYAPVEADASDSVVVDLPLSWASGTIAAGHPPDQVIHDSESMPLLRATQHGHPVAYGFAARIAPEQLADLSRNRFYTDLLLLQGGSIFYGPVPTATDPKAGAANARRIGVRWVVVWPEASRRVIPYLRRAGFRRESAERGAILFGRVG